jgi:hypothetical protein
LGLRKYPLAFVIEVGGGSKKGGSVKEKYERKRKKD